MTEGTITRWMKSVGDAVERDEPLFEVSTDKVDSEVPSPAAGVLTEILVSEGDTVEVGVKLAVIGDSADAPAAAAEPLRRSGSCARARPAPAPEPAAAPAPAPEAPAPTAADSDSDSDALVLSPVVRKLLSENGISASEHHRHRSRWADHPRRCAQSGGRSAQRARCCSGARSRCCTGAGTRSGSGRSSATIAIRLDGLVSQCR